MWGTVTRLLAQNHSLKLVFQFERISYAYTPSWEVDVKILLADDHGLFRDSMAVWLRQLAADVEIALAADWHDLLNALTGETFHLLLLDLDMPDMQGAASIEKLRREHSGLPILVVSGNQETATIEACLAAGAAGYMAKTGSGHDILKAVRTVLDGGSWRPPEQGRGTAVDFIKTLSHKQIRILSHLAQGDSNRTIAEQLALSEGTVKQYVSQLLSILDVDNRTQASIRARQILGIAD